MYVLRLITLSLVVVTLSSVSTNKNVVVDIVVAVNVVVVLVVVVAAVVVAVVAAAAAAAAVVVVVVVEIVKSFNKPVFQKSDMGNTEYTAQTETSTCLYLLNGDTASSNSSVSTYLTFLVKHL